jgi:hypothetical protein
VASSARGTRAAAALAASVLAGLACGEATLPTPAAAPALPATEPAWQVPAYGFFPSPSEATLASVLETYAALGEHADVILLQQNVPWQDFLERDDGPSERITDIQNQRILADQYGLEIIFVVDPLNGLNRREFFGLPEDLAPASFATPEVRRAYRNFTLRVVREIQPSYLGLASEINTYADAHPEDFPHFLSLYRETYAAVKAEAPDTRVFVSFQWEDLNNLFADASEGRAEYATNWDQVEAFEPDLDLWVISSYPFAAFSSGSQIPADYYTPLLGRTDKPVAVAEGGYTSRPVGPFAGEPQDQVDYLQAIHTQLGGRLVFWIYLLLNDFDQEAWAEQMRAQGIEADDIETLGMFASVGLREADGTPKPAMGVWDGLREDRAP